MQSQISETKFPIFFWPFQIEFIKIKIYQIVKKKDGKKSLNVLIVIKHIKKNSRWNENLKN